MKLAIIIVAYNRDHTLKRLLASLESAKVNAPQMEIHLVISIDQSDNEKVLKIAEEFSWDLGPKKIITHKERQGLKKHILKSGDLVEEYENIIMLEDDLWLSPYFWKYSIDSINFCKDNKQICQISLYSNVFNETSLLPFIPYMDGNDNYYMKIPSSWGQIWTKDQWNGFKEWLPEYEANEKKFNESLPPNVKIWPDTSWKKIFYNYVIEKNKLVFYPRLSLTTNFMDAGTHHKGSAYYLQTPTLTFKIDNYCFSSIEESKTIYDEFCERDDDCYRAELKANLGIENVIVDLYGTKNLDLYPGKYTLTSQKVPGDIKSYFTMGMRPHELNINSATMSEVKTDYKLTKIPNEGNLNLPTNTRPTSLDQILCYYVLPKRILPKTNPAKSQKIYITTPTKQKKVKITRKQAILTLLPFRLVRILKKFKSNAL